MAGNNLIIASHRLSCLSTAHKNGILDTTTPHQSWPKDVLRQIFNELKSSTPDFLISNELLGSSTSAEEWWNKTKRFGRSVAVMSMIGYILGLGDRHLDNILLDIHDGSLVHIDFNVCFEKGKRLQIPETVPFRLTQNIVKALAPLGQKVTFEQLASTP
jgi:serine/threonine-protein kinase SMG1